MSALKLGKRPATYDARDVRYAALRADVAAKLPQAPSSFGHGNDFGNWKMLGNGPAEGGDGFPAQWVAAKEGCGDCAWAGPAHETMELCRDAGRPVPDFTGEIVVKQYGEYCGYDPETGENDEGSSPRDVLSWRQKKGLKAADGSVHKIGAYVSLEPGNLQHIIEAAFLFECVGIGFEVPESAEEQFGRGEPWSVVPGAEIVGGHYVPVVGRPRPGELAVVTWARRQFMTEAFFEKYCDEAWAFMSAERFKAVTGKDYEGYDAAQLNEYLRFV